MLQRLFERPRCRSYQEQSGAAAIAALTTVCSILVGGARAAWSHVPSPGGRDQSWGSVVRWQPAQPEPLKTAMRVFPILLATATLAASAATLAAEPEIKRETGIAQAIGAAHTLRSIPEACARLEGKFTGDAAGPYQFVAVRSSPQCQPRARFVDFDKANPSAASGWKFNDLIRVPNAACPSQQAVVRVWRKPAATAAAPTLDAQGRARIYLEDAKQAAAAGRKLPAVEMYAAQMKVEGNACP